MVDLVEDHHRRDGFALYELVDVVADRLVVSTIPCGRVLAAAWSR